MALKRFARRRKRYSQLGRKLAARAKRLALLSRTRTKIIRKRRGLKTRLSTPSLHVLRKFARRLSLGLRGTKGGFTNTDRFERVLPLLKAISKRKKRAKN
jgi:hypothetical protein